MSNVSVSRTFPKSFVVNLKRDTQRRRHMRRLCERVGLEVEFIEAVYGQEIPDIDFYIQQNKAETVRLLGRELTPGEIGCAMSHQKIYRKMMDENIGFALILEDDIEFEEEGFVELVGTLLDREGEWEIVLLGYSGGGNRQHWDVHRQDETHLAGPYTSARLNQQGYGTYGYLVTLQGARKLYAQSTSYILPIDHYTGDFQNSRIWVVLPPPVWPYERLSDRGILIGERAGAELRYLKQKFHKYLQWIEMEIGCCETVVLYGYNDFARLIYFMFKDKVTAIVDTYKKGYQIEGIRIIAIEDLKEKNPCFFITAIDSNKILQIRSIIADLYKNDKIISL